jgi:hypothetical protein
MNNRESQILCGLFLSKFNERALESLGFDNFAEAYNVLGSALDVRPSTIKNYRDELDPYFLNQRKGWHQRPLRKHCENVLHRYGGLRFSALAAEVKLLFDPVADLPGVTTDYVSEDEVDSTTFAKRLVTGRAAEGYFRTNYHSHQELLGGLLVDTTETGCGFDFRINFAESPIFFAVEVKGLSESCGNLALTEKEHRRAEQLRDRYFLYVVRNFKDAPFASMWRDPLDSLLQWQLTKQEQIITSWRTKI